jgi:hypothetical protein
MPQNQRLVAGLLPYQLQRVSFGKFNASHIALGIAPKQIGIQQHESGDERPAVFCRVAPQRLDRGVDDRQRIATVEHVR